MASGAPWSDGPSGTPLGLFRLALAIRTTGAVLGKRPRCRGGALSQVDRGFFGRRAAFSDGHIAVGKAVSSQA